MPNPLVASPGLLLLLAAPSAAPEPPEWARAALLLRQERVTVHVPRVSVTSTTIIMRTRPQPPAMVEKKADDCVKVEKLSGFTVNRFDSVDLMLKDGKVLRAKLGKNCPALGFYSGFYVKANKDRKICAGRDFFRSRSGRSCGVEKFASMVPAR